MQLRSRTIATVTTDEQAPKPAAAPASKRARRTPSAHSAVSSMPDDSVDRSSDDNDILPLSENGVRHAIRFADHFMEHHNTSLHAHFVADGRRLYRRWQECDLTTRSGANSKRMMQRDFEAFVRFVQNEAGVDITDDVK